MPHIDIVFEGDSPNLKFVEVENERGESVQVGEWVERPDGKWVLRVKTNYFVHAAIAQSNGDVCLHKSTVSIYRDEVGNLFECLGCGMRNKAPGKFAWTNKVTCLEPTSYLATQGETLMQLWHCRRTGKKEWRPLPTLDAAMALYGGEIGEAR